MSGSLPGSARRLGATLVDLARQRLELAALDVDEQVLRLLALQGLLLAATAFGALTLAAFAATLVVLLWDGARHAALVAVTLSFAAATVACGWRLRQALRTKPAFLAGTLAELREDAQHLEPAP